MPEKIAFFVGEEFRVFYSPYSRYNLIERKGKKVKFNILLLRFHGRLLEALASGFLDTLSSLIFKVSGFTLLPLNHESSL